MTGAGLALWVQGLGLWLAFVEQGFLRGYNALHWLLPPLRGPPVSLRFGHRTALALLMQFTIVLPLRYLPEGGKGKPDLESEVGRWDIKYLY